MLTIDLFLQITLVSYPKHNTVYLVLAQQARPKLTRYGPYLQELCILEGDMKHMFYIYT